MSEHEQQELDLLGVKVASFVVFFLVFFHTATPRKSIKEIHSFKRHSISTLEIEKEIQHRFSVRVVFEQWQTISFTTLKF